MASVPMAFITLMEEGEPPMDNEDLFYWFPSLGENNWYYILCAVTEDGTLIEDLDNFAPTQGPTQNVLRDTPKEHRWKQALEMARSLAYNKSPREIYLKIIDAARKEAGSHEIRRLIKNLRAAENLTRDSFGAIFSGVDPDPYADHLAYDLRRQICLEGNVPCIVFVSMHA